MARTNNDICSSMTVSVSWFCQWDMTDQDGG